MTDRLPPPQSDRDLLERAARLTIERGTRHPADFDELLQGRGWTYALMTVRTLARGNHGVLGALIAASVTAGCGIVAPPLAEDWVRIATDPTEQTYRQAAVAVGRYAQTLCTEAAAYRHNCSRCVYLETMSDPTVVDLYACPRHGPIAPLLFVVRFGDGVNEFMSSDRPDAADRLHFDRARELADSRQLRKWR
ncbi:MAG TPA: hypothetical protein VLI05_04875 [Candidatus Saccharimonadia bacterium]|nr:hypothetical protein [Candidatus Saccharimonadia bacterium]